MRPVKKMERLFVMQGCQIGAYAGKTAGGVIIDERWRGNDGLVNTVSPSKSKPPTPPRRCRIFSRGHADGAAGAHGRSSKCVKRQFFH